jgi:hypothetical protein
MNIVEALFLAFLFVSVSHTERVTQVCAEALVGLTRSQATRYKRRSKKLTLLSFVLFFLPLFLLVPFPHFS